MEPPLHESSTYSSSSMGRGIPLFFSNGKSEKDLVNAVDAYAATCQNSRNDHDSSIFMLRYNLEDESFIAGSGIGANELAKKTRAISSIMQELPLSFSDTLIAHMKRKGITSERLAEACHVSSNSISRLRREAYPNTSLSNVVSLCVGLNLHPLMAKDLIQKAGYSFNGSLEHVAYQMILFSMTNSSLEECNDYLKSVGVKQLGTEE